MRKDTTPEEKLLKLIKKKKEPAESPKPEDAKPASQGPARLDGVLKSEIFKNKIFEPSALKNINKYLVIILGIGAVYFLADLIFVRPYRNIEKIISGDALTEPGKEKVPGSAEAVAVKGYDSYSSAVSNKNIFSPYSGGLGGDNVAVSGDISEKLGLVGVITGDSPQAIIEDKKSQKTYYLNKGQSFDGYIVEEISEGKVILNSGGNKISLFL